MTITLWSYMEDGVCDLSEEAQCNPTPRDIIVQQLEWIEDAFEKYKLAIESPRTALWWNADFETLLAKIDLILIEPNLHNEDRAKLQRISDYIDGSKWEAVKIQEQSRERSAQIIAMRSWSDEDRANYEAMRKRIDERKAA